MRRLHLFEWEDMPWLPSVLRTYATDFLRYSQTGKDREETNRLIAEKIGEAMARSGERRIIDLGSGAGGPIIEIAKHLEVGGTAVEEIVLTDLYPGPGCVEETKPPSGIALRYERKPVSATEVPTELRGMRTMFNAFHHFAPADARRVLADAVRKRAPFASFELLTRNVLMVSAAPLAIFLRALVITPRIGRMTAWRAFLTYLLPLAPLMAAWDGTVSCLRTYNDAELRALTAGLSGYAWEIGTIPLSDRMLPPITYLVGIPAANSDSR